MLMVSQEHAFELVRGVYVVVLVDGVRDVGVGGGGFGLV